MVRPGDVVIELPPGGADVPKPESSSWPTPAPLPSPPAAARNRRRLVRRAATSLPCSPRLRRPLRPVILDVMPCRRPGGPSRPARRSHPLRRPGSVRRPLALGGGGGDGGARRLRGAGGADPRRHAAARSVPAAPLPAADRGLLARSPAAPSSPRASSPTWPPPPSPGSAGRSGGASVGRLAVGPAARAMALAAVNPNLWILGQHVSTDMFFAALAAGSLLAGLRYLEEPAREPLSPAARSSASPPSPARTPSSCSRPCSPPGGWRPEKKSGGAGGPTWPRRGRRRPRPGAPLGVAPGGLRRSVPRRELEEPGLEAPRLSGLVLPGPRAVLRRARRGAGRSGRGRARGPLGGRPLLFGGGAPQLFGTWAHVLLLVAGGDLAVRRKPGLPSGSSAPAAFSSRPIAFAFFAWGRLLLLLIPPCYGLAFAPWGSVRRGTSAF